MNYNYSKFSSPVGVLHILSNSQKLVALIFDSNWKTFSEKSKMRLTQRKDNIIRKTEKQLKEYFSGYRKNFEIPIEFFGTDFQHRAWKTLRQIPYGQTISYAEQAIKMKNPKAVRAVGGANGKNNICIIIPCHRVIGKNGKLTGFSGGLDIKKQLLKHENII